MALPLPSSLSPSKVSAFKDCALAFRFSAIDKLVEPPSPAATKGSIVHRALESLFTHRPAERNRALAAETLDAAVAEFEEEGILGALDLDHDQRSAFLDDASLMVDRYFQLEDPTTFDPVGVELMLSTEVGGLTLRGIIDRLDLDADGELVVTDYKTGRVPSERQELARLGGVHFYALLCERILGRRPTRVQLMYLGPQPQVIVARPTDQSIAGLERRIEAIWSAIERACEHEDFRPKQSALCNVCNFKPYCPLYGGDPAQALVDLSPRTAAVPA
ncbi:MAG: PD-(D/E)XK nuclease family protein [Microthrixaceae bacterium]